MTTSSKARLPKIDTSLPVGKENRSLRPTFRSDVSMPMLMSGLNYLLSTMLLLMEQLCLISLISKSPHAINLK